MSMNLIVVDNNISNIDTNIILINPAAIEAEKEKNKFLNGIENFDPTKLKHTETCEKNPLPTKDIIEQEKTAWTSLPITTSNYISLVSLVF